MADALTLQTMLDQPDLATAQVERRSTAFTLRPLLADDASRLADYFASLSPQTRRWFAPHKFTPEVAAELCVRRLSEETLRLVAVTGSERPAVVAYFILLFGVRSDDGTRFGSYGIPLDARTDCTLAPSVADAYQSFGLGSAMMTHAIEVARKAAKTRIVLFGGVNADNAGAVHFYEKFGFRTVATFGSDAGKYDMILDLATSRNQGI